MRGEDNIRIVHVADTHLGYSAYRKVDNDGVNQREKDIYRAFINAVDRIVDIKPDIVIHAGDLFDSVRPTNRAITVAMDQILRLSKNNIPVVLISGNHETPKLKGTAHIFKLFEHIDKVYPIYASADKISFEIKGKTITIHAVPHCRNAEEFSESIESVFPDPSSDYNVLVTHGAVQSIQVFKMGDINEYAIPFATISKGFDYVALGHYHGFTRIKNNIVYSGSTERMGFNEAGEDKGFVMVQLSRNVSTEFIKIPTRNMVELGPLDCKNKKPRDIYEEIKRLRSGRDLRGSIVRLTLTNIEPSVYKSMDISQIHGMFSDTIHFEIRHHMGESPEHAIPSEVIISDIITEFEKFIEKKNCKDKEILLSLGKKYLQEVEEEQT